MFSFEAGKINIAGEIGVLAGLPQHCFETPDGIGERRGRALTGASLQTAEAVDHPRLEPFGPKSLPPA